MSDALSLLREQTMRGATVTLQGDSFQLGGRTFPRNTPTPFQNKTKKDFYPLDSLWFLWQHKDRPHHLYLTECLSNKFAAVSLPDKKPIIDYLSGEIDSHPSLAIKPLDEVQIEPRVGPKEVEKVPEVVEAVDEDIASQKETFGARLDKLARRELDEPLPEEPAKRQKTAFITADEAATKAISKKERLVASRKSILNCKRDLTDLMELFQKHTQELEKEKRRQQAEQADNTMRQLRNARYDKDHDTQKYWKEKTGSETVFDIDTTGSFVAGGGLGGLLGDTPAKPKAAAPTQPNKQLSPAPLPKRQKQQSAESTPIIMIPNAMRGSLLSMLNCKDFLISYRFVPDVAGEKPAMVKLQRVNKTGLPQTFRVFDSPLRLKESDWPHVVAVVALGQKWQFKGWPNGWSEPVNLFSKAAGFYFYQEDTEIPEAIKSWAVHKILISKNKRHLDHTAATEFWTQLERSMELNGLQT